jgi:hypothetical protein
MTSAGEGSRDPGASFIDALDAQMREAGFAPPSADERTAPTPGRRRARRSGPGTVAAPQVATLTEVDGVLRWEESGGVGPAPRRRAARGAGAGRLPGEGGVLPPAQRDVVRFQMEHERLEPSKIGAYLEALDRRFAPHPGLRRYDGARLLPAAAPPASGRILLLVHGTFSSADHLLDELRATAPGRRFLDAAMAKDRYDAVLAFDHPTLSVGPILNAIDLGRALAGSRAAVDVVAHSRGGLVARWWREHFDDGRAERRLVLVGAPLEGTSLAAAPRLRSALNLLTNVARAVGGLATLGAGAMPLLGVVAGLVRIVSSVTAAAAQAPLVDAAVAMIPGLSAQARVANNLELERLRLRGAPAPAGYFAVRADFRPKSPGWAFWEHFTQLKSRSAHLAADLVFDAPNDLVVETSSMTRVGPSLAIPTRQVLDFGRTATVHHMNYFRDARTIAALRRWLDV